MKRIEWIYWKVYSIKIKFNGRTLQALEKKYFDGDATSEDGFEVFEIPVVLVPTIKLVSNLLIILRFHHIYNHFK